MSSIYLDYAATTPMDERVLQAMLSVMRDCAGNASSLHSFGRKACSALRDARETVAAALGSRHDEVYFTSSATESNNTVLKGVVEANASKGRHIIISSIEHDCIMNTARWLEKRGIEVSRVGVDEDGFVDPADVSRMMRKDTVLVSVMHANNEIGTIQPIAEIASICRQSNVLFHTDASQTFGKIPIDVRSVAVDLLTASSHKMYGPKGAGLMYIRKGVRVEPLLHGGDHESGMRASTVNVAAIAGFAKAVELCFEEMECESARLSELRDRIIQSILSEIGQAYLNGHITERLPNNANIRFSYVEGESLLMKLDQKGIAVSTGSACSSQTLEPSHVLLACGLRPEEAHGSLRISLGRWTTEQEVEVLIRELPKAVAELRKISPFGGNGHVL